MKKTGLGKGLDALFADNLMSNEENLDESTEKIHKIKVIEIEPNRDQPRRNFDEEALDELATSIKTYGVLQPIIVNKKDDYYEIVAGERRWRAAKKAGLSEMPCIIKDDITEKSNKEIIINPNEEKYVDIVLTNTYSQTVKYGMYYYMIEPNTQVDGLIVSLSEDSLDLLENIIKPNQTRSISLKIVNNSDTQIDILVGALVGFEKGEIKDLAQNGEILIK